MNKTLFTLYTIITMCLPAFLYGQVSDSRRITAEEKRALEKQFEELKTFYIDDEGVVVYQQIEEKATTSTSNQQTTVEPQERVKVKVSVDESGDYVVTTEEVVDTIFVNEEEIPAETTVRQENDKQENSYQVQAEEAGKAAKSVKNEVFRKRESSYKSLEEAALAVDALLEEFKKQQNQQSGRGKGSLSQKLSRGVDGSLRENTYEFSNSNKVAENEKKEEVDVNDSPTFYINGVLATKEEVDKLKRKDILKKTIKRSKNNPNGEWWIETRQK